MHQCRHCRIASLGYVPLAASPPPTVYEVDGTVVSGTLLFIALVVDLLLTDRRKLKSLVFTFAGNSLSA